MSSLGLLDLANQHFYDLTEPELHFLKSVRAGKEDRIESATLPRRILRCEIIRWLCTNEEAKKFVDPFGIQIHFAEITALPNSKGECVLDFSSLILPFPLVFKNCVLPSKVRMLGMEATFLSFEDSKIGCIEADVLRIKGDFYLRGESFSSNGFVRFPGATIGGDLDCNGARFNNSPVPPPDQPPDQPPDPNNGIALNGSGISVGGDVLLGRAVVKGRLLLEGANLQGDLDCTGAKLLNPYQHPLEQSGLALEADHLSLKGSLSLKKSHDSPKAAFLAQGEIRLLAAHIGGQLVCSGAIVENPKDERDDRGQTGDVFSAEGIDVQGQAFFRGGFSANGNVLLGGATIGGHLVCKDASFTALTLASASVARRFVWKGITYMCTPNLDFKNLSVVALEDDLESWPQNGTYALDGFTYRHVINGCSPARNRITWIARQTPFAPQPYRQLAQTLEEEGDEQGARRVRFEMAKRSAKKEKGFLRSPANAIFHATVGYGYYPSYALFWLIVLFGLGFVVYYSSFYSGLIAPTDKAAYACFAATCTLPAQYERFHASLYSLENSLPVLKLGQADHWQPDPQRETLPPSTRGCPPLLKEPRISPRFLRCFRWSQICLGWILGIMGLGAISGVIRRD
jgi:hypothetical protein